MAIGSDEVSQSDRILDAAESVLRRHGAEKTNVVDIARVLGMSHGNIYRHYPSKKALLNAIAVRWLGLVTTPLAAIAADTARPADERLEAWFDALRAAKRRKLRDDPELFRMYFYIAAKEPELVEAHVAALLGHVKRVIADGVAGGEFHADIRPAAAARALLHGMSAFNHPAMLMQDKPATDADARAVFGLLLAGLAARPA